MRNKIVAFVYAEPLLCAAIVISLPFLIMLLPIMAAAYVVIRVVEWEVDR